MSDFSFHKFMIDARTEILTALVTVNDNVNRLRQEISDMQGNPQEIADITAQLHDKTQALATALASFPGQPSTAPPVV